MNRLQELKVQASILRKQLKSSEKQLQEKAAKRFLQLPFHLYSTVDNVLADVDFYQLKHAYWVLAVENNYETWQQYRDAIIREECMYTGSAGAFLNVWFANYDEAKNYQLEKGGYLLPYRKDYFVCNEALIQELGLAEYKKEWEEINYDWAKPKNKKAWTVIYKTAKKNYLTRCKSSTKIKPIDISKRPEWLKKA